LRFLLKEIPPASVPPSETKNCERHFMNTTFQTRSLRPDCRRSRMTPATGEPRSLARAVQASAQLVDDRALRPVVKDYPRSSIKPKVLLTLLSRCYANQIYGSTEIARSLERCLESREFFENATADARLIRQFRQDNREALQTCLTAALRFAVEEKVRAGTVTRISEAQLVEEAKRRIIMAMFIDSMAMDGE
jgi:hypothetical protein